MCCVYRISPNRNSHLQTDPSCDNGLHSYAIMTILHEYHNSPHSNAGCLCCKYRDNRSFSNYALPVALKLRKSGLIYKSNSNKIR